MAHKYFTKQLLDKSNNIDLANIFSDKQEDAKKKLNTDYSIPQIADWIKENTNNFKKQDGYYIDLDQALKRVVFKYYDSTSQVNPFSEEVDDEVVELGQPRRAVEVTSEGIKLSELDIKEKTPSIEKVVEQVSDEIQSIKDAIEIFQAVIDGDNDMFTYDEAVGALEYFKSELESLTESI
jgi:hypothetical protein